MNHEEKECFTKKRDDKRKKERKTSKVQETEDNSDDDINISQIKVRTAETTFPEKMGFFMYDIGASHSTTNDKSLLHNIKKVNLSVNGHDGQNNDMYNS